MKTISKELAEVLLPAIEHALQNAEPVPLTTELFGELLLTQSYTPSLVEPATDEARQRDPSRSIGQGANCVWFLVWDYYAASASGNSYITAYYTGFNEWKGVTDGN